MTSRWTKMEWVSISWSPKRSRELSLTQETQRCSLWWRVKFLYPNLGVSAHPSTHDCDVKWPKPKERWWTSKLLIYGSRAVAVVVVVIVVVEVVIVKVVVVIMMMMTMLWSGPDQVNHRGGFRRGSRGPHRPPGGVKGLFFCFVSFREGTCIG